MIKYILFDFGGVLTESGRSGFITATIAELYGQDPKTINIADYHAALRRGKGSDEKMFEDLNQLYHKQVTKAMFLDKVHDAFKPSAAVYELAEQLRTHGIKTGILSNIFAMNAEVLRREGWYEGFDPVILSCDIGYAKPDQGIYDIAIERCGVAPSEILFIDDQDKCLGPAADAGMQVLKAVSTEQIVADVRTMVRRQSGVSL